MLVYGVKKIFLQSHDQPAINPLTVFLMVIFTRSGIKQNLGFSFYPLQSEVGLLLQIDPIYKHGLVGQKNIPLKGFGV